MANPQAQTLIDLEKKFWQSMIDEETDVALSLMTEPSFMVSPKGAFKFDHAMYRQMAEHGDMVITDYEFEDVDVTFPNDTTAIVTYQVRQRVAPRGKGETTEQHMRDTSTWVNKGRRWQCVMHTEMPVPEAPAKH